MEKEDLEIGEKEGRKMGKSTKGSRNPTKRNRK